MCAFKKIIWGGVSRLFCAMDVKIANVAYITIHYTVKPLNNGHQGTMKNVRLIEVSA